MTIKRKIHFRLGKNNSNRISDGEPTPLIKRPTRSAECMAFAIVFDDWLSSGKVQDYSEICNATGLSRSAVSRIMGFRLRASKEQERIIFS